MEKLKELVTAVLNSSQFKRFLWNTLNGAVAVSISVISEMDIMYSAVIFAIMNGITKEANKRLSSLNKK